MADEKMVKVTINGKECQVKAGTNLVDAAEANGIDIPHYCYHPGLPIAGQCRMCYVEVPGQPKLNIACNMKCTDGLTVVSNSEKVTQAVTSSLEMHLINHPIDCPICDQAGECGLQDYYMEFGKHQSEMREHKVNKEKVVDIGDHVVLDKERCILCTRCVRFTAEVSKTHDFGIFQRGDRSVIGTYGDAPLKGNYQLNTVDICPVGALTSKDFRFEQRVWFLEEAPSICSGCSKGCNVSVHHKKGKHIYRLKPRENQQVNQWWMCDQGRYTYKNSNYDRRLTTAAQAGVELAYDAALQQWATDLKVLIAMEKTEEVGVFITPHHTHEELSSMLSTLRGDFGITKFCSEDIEGFVKNDATTDGFLLRSDPYPNSRGFLKALQAQKIKLQSVSDLTNAIQKGQINHLIVFAPEGTRILASLHKVAAALKPDAFVVVITPQLQAAESFPSAITIPSISHYEKSGTMTNHAGLDQVLSSTFRMFKDARSVQEILEDLNDKMSASSRQRRAQ